MVEPGGGCRIVISTAGSDEQAETIARALVERKLAACVNVVGEVCSIYRWRGAVERDPEKLLLIKTSAQLVEKVRQTIRELHSYELPELLTLAVAEADPDYRAWIEANVEP